jgi:hypothetical protein
VGVGERARILGGCGWPRYERGEERQRQQPHASPR